MPEADPLIRTKLNLPYIRPGLVSRPRLQKQVAEGLCGPLTVIIAPAGFGKTTLLASVASSSGMPTAWLSLDKDDNPIWRFLSYFLAALREAEPTMGSEAAQLLAAPQQATPETILTSLINDLVLARKELILVLDDYQFINNQDVHEGVAFLLEHLPKTFHLVIATRSDPPLPLARMRARGQMVELRATDLRFSETEAVQFLNEGMGLHLDARSVAVLEERTEGWVAGLQMAALSMRGREDVHEFIDGFSGTNRHILDYLLEEILANQPQEVQHFLLFTSILERLAAPLCDAVLAQATSIPHRSSASILGYLERANVFLVPMDDERIWYRYHHLFADLLHQQLSQNYPQAICELHQRASRWYEDNELPDQAMEHAFQAQDYPRAARLLEKMSALILSRTDRSWSWLLQWFQKIPEDLLQSNARLLVAKATLLASEGRVAAAEACLLDAESCLADGSGGSVSPDWVAGKAATVRAMIASFHNDAVAALQQAEKALRVLPAGEDLDWRAYLLITVSRIDLQAGDLSASGQNLREALEIARLHGHSYLVLDAIAHLAPVLWMQGHLKKADRLCRDGQHFIEENGLGRSPLAGVFFINWGLILTEQRELPQAEAALEKGMQLLENASPLSIIWAKQIWTRYLIAKGDLYAASQAIREIHSIQQQVNYPATIVTGFSAVEAFVWLRLREIHKVEQYFADHGIFAEGSIAHPHQWEYHALVRLLTDKGELDAAKLFLKRLLLWAETVSQQYWTICYLIDLAILDQAQGNPKEALQSLNRAMALAEPDRIIQVFADEGEALRKLLVEAVKQGDHLQFSRMLLASQTNLEAQPQIGELSTQPGLGIVEPLSGRELEVLQLIAAGKTNQDIADQLIISVGTVKAHTTNIYRKLDVANRTEAVARAREFGLLS